MAPEQWEPLQRGSLKLNVDGSLAGGEMTGAVAGVLRDHFGCIVTGFAASETAASPLEIEALALRRALDLPENRTDWADHR